MDTVIRLVVPTFLFAVYWHFYNRLWDIQRIRFGDLWPRESRSTVNLGSTTMVLFERPYPISYLPSIDTFSLSCTVFEIIDIFVNMGNPYSGPKIGGLGGFWPPPYIFFNSNHQKAHVLLEPRLLSHCACKSAAPFRSYTADLLLVTFDPAYLGHPWPQRQSG